MAKSVNKALLLGYVGKAPEIRSTASGTLVASLSLATAERQEDRKRQTKRMDEVFAAQAAGVRSAMR